MKADIKAEWKKNLRSGKFAQGNGQLRTWDEENQRWVYCCLGVLCEMSGLAEWVEFTDSYNAPAASYLGEQHYLPPEVAEWAGIDPSNEEEGDVQQRLGTLNDSGLSFTAISDKLDTTHDL